MNRPPDWMACTDTHGDMIDPAARDAALRFAEIHKPKTRIDMGDVFDFRALRKKATAEERSESVQTDVEAGEKWLKDYRPTHVLWGNHDFRLWEAAEGCADGNLKMLYRQLADRIGDNLEAIGAEAYPYDIQWGIMQYGNRKFMHGYHHNIHSAEKAGSIYGNVTFGHVHRFQRASPERDDHPVAWSCGCMCKLDMGYNRRRTATLRWQQGFMYGWKDDETGHVSTFTIEPVGGRWHIPKGFD